MIKYLDGDKQANHFLEAAKRCQSLGKATLVVQGDGPFRRQIERMAKEAGVKVVERQFQEVSAPYDVDVVNKQNVCDFFVRQDSYGQIPCVVEAINTLILMYCDYPQGITVLGRGRFGAFAAAFIAREYGRVTWQSASEPIEKAGIIVNCSREALESYPDGSTVIDINKLGRLTTAILLLRTAMSGHGEIKLV